MTTLVLIAVILGGDPSDELIRLRLENQLLRMRVQALEIHKAESDVARAKQDVLDAIEAIQRPDKPLMPPVSTHPAPTPERPAAPSYQRQCGCARGTRPSACDCLKAGVKCHCPEGRQSTWQVSKVITPAAKSSEVVTVYCPASFTCPYCEAWKSVKIDGVEFEFVKRDWSRWQSYPVLKVNGRHYYNMSTADLKALVSHR